MKKNNTFEEKNKRYDTIQKSLGRNDSFYWRKLDRKLEQQGIKGFICNGIVSVYLEV